MGSSSSVDLGKLANPPLIPEKLFWETARNEEKFCKVHPRFSKLWEFSSSRTTVRAEYSKRTELRQKYFSYLRRGHVIVIRSLKPARRPVYASTPYPRIVRAKSTWPPTISDKMPLKHLHALAAKLLRICFDFYFAKLLEKSGSNDRLHILSSAQNFPRRKRRAWNSNVSGILLYGVRENDIG